MARFYEQVTEWEIASSALLRSAVIAMTKQIPPCSAIF
jgi:hypothetical protein